MSNNNQNNNNQDNNNNNNFFNNNPIIVFVIFSLISVMVFKNLFPQDDMNVNGSQSVYGQVNKSISYSDLKGLISTGQIDYLGIGNTTLKATSSSNGVKTSYSVRIAEIFLFFI